jgi:predicted N-formylglutamate amidohydrolase
MQPQAAFESINPEGKAPVLLVCDHASRAFPPHLGTLGVPEPDTWEHIAWDIGAAELARGLAARLDAPAILATCTRLVIDCNRHVDQATLFVTETDGIPVPGNVDMTAADRDWRIRTLYEPYHAAIEAKLEAMEVGGRVPALVAMHSFTPLLGEQARPWHVGILWDSDARLPRPVMNHLRAVPGLHVGDNQPYSGRHPTDYTMHAHGGTRGRAHVAFEVRQDLLATAGGIDYWVGLIAEALTAALADPIVYRRSVPGAYPGTEGRRGV